jgi:hypothetical protein
MISFIRSFWLRCSVIAGRTGRYNLAFYISLCTVNPTNFCNGDCLRAGEVNSDDVFVFQFQDWRHDKRCAAPPKFSNRKHIYAVVSFLESISRPVVLSAADEEKSNASHTTLSSLLLISHLCLTVLKKKLNTTSSFILN